MTLLASLVAAGVMGCENLSKHSASNGTSRSDFDRKTERTYNPLTKNYEQEPPYGPRSNKSE